MDDEYEEEGLLVLYAVEDEHRLDSEMPGTGAVGRRHDDGEVGHDERHEGTAEAEVGREVEAEEGQVVMQEVTYPDAYGEQQVERQVLDAA